MDNWYFENKDLFRGPTKGIEYIYNQSSCIVTDDKRAMLHANKKSHLRDFVRPMI